MRILKGGRPPIRRRSPYYPWTTWMDGKVREAERGVDYAVSDETFGSVLRNRARRCGVLVSHWRTDAGVAFQFRTAGKEKQ